MIAYIAGRAIHMGRRAILAGLLTALVVLFFRLATPDAPRLDTKATAVVFMVAYGLVYATERLMPILYRLLSRLRSSGCSREVKE
jgi:hypothetical protein